MSNSINERQAYEAMYCFLQDYYFSTKIDAIGSLLGDLSLMGDDKPVDQAVWGIWLNCVEKARNREVDPYLKLKK